MFRFVSGFQMSNFEITSVFGEGELNAQCMLKTKCGTEINLEKKHSSE